MFGMFNTWTSTELAVGFSILAVVLIALGFISDIVTKDHGFGPPVNGAILVAGAGIGVAALLYYQRFAYGPMGVNLYQAHMFDIYLVQTVVVASVTAMAFFIITLLLKHFITD